jgi:hypothetical protein
MLSFSRTGMPCIGPRTLPRERSLSSSRASRSALRLTIRTALSAGPAVFVRAIRARYAFVSVSALSDRSAIRRCRSAIVVCSSENGSSGSLPTMSSSSSPGAQECAPYTLGGSVSAHRYIAGLITLGGLRSRVACS